MDTVTFTMKAAQDVKAGQAVRTTGSPTTVTPAVEKEKLHTTPFFGVALERADIGHDVTVQIGGIFNVPLDPGRAGAVGVDSSGRIVRASNTKCMSAPNWIGDCDDSGMVTIRPHRDTRLNVLDFGAIGDGKANDTGPLQAALDCATRFKALDCKTGFDTEQVSDGKVVYLPPGDYRITSPLVVRQHCILEGAGGRVLSGTKNTRILADVVGRPDDPKPADFNLSRATGIGPVGGETVYCAIALTGAWTTTSESAEVPSRARADYAELRQFTLESCPDQGISAKTFHQARQMDAVRVLATGSLIASIGISGFRRNGITIYASDPPFTPHADANETQIRDCVLDNNGQHGLDIGGESQGNNETNAMLIMSVDASGNGRDGIHDNSFLGCTFIACHTAANKHRNISSEHSSITYSVYLGCYAEVDAPAVFKGGNIAVVGGDMDITPDSTYWGYGAVRGGPGPSALKVNNNFSKVEFYRIVLGGIYIDQGELKTGGEGSKAQGYLYRAQNSGRTRGVVLPDHPSGEPGWKTTTGSLTEDGDVTWECLGKVEPGADAGPMVITSNTLGSKSDSTIIQDFDSVPLDSHLNPVGNGSSLFRTQVRTDRPPDTRKGRIETSMLSGAPFHTYYQTAYENGPVPGALMLPEAWIGRPDNNGERRIGVVYSGTPFDTSVGSCYFYRPGDLILNAYNDSTRQGPIGWAVQAPCGRGKLARTWTPGTHYQIGQTVKSTPANDFVYLLTTYKPGDPLDPHLKVSGPSQPSSWNPNQPQQVGAVTEDNYLEWVTLYDLDVPANRRCLEQIPQSVPDQKNSNATEIGKLREDFNALLAKLRAAHLLDSAIE
ncbi:capsid cement protein [Embleya sp. NPDC059237]|uniref:capsid cement protein n=1 Tax=Embleya sp. NPDC059237 TaxID=3346784 RepID=UPI003691076C